MSQPSAVLDPTAVVGRVAAVLAAGAALPSALAELVAGLQLRAAVVRTPDGELLAVAGEVLHAVPPGRALGTAGPTIEIPVPGRSALPIARLTIVGARPSQLAVLRAAAAVIGLLLVGGNTPGADVLLTAAADDLDELADQLHDGPLQLLVAARYSVDAAARGADPTAVRAAVQEAVVHLRRVVWNLRPRTDVALGAALTALSARVVEAGGPAIVQTSAPSAAQDLRGAAAGTAYRLVQAVAQPGAPACRVTLRREAGCLVVLLHGGAALTSPHRWTARVRALGGELTTSPSQLRLVLPISDLRTSA